MKYLEYDINNMTISKTAGNKTSPISGSVNYFGVHFNFDDEFAAISGAKAAEFFKEHNNVRVDLVDGKCLIPNDMLKSKEPFEMRVLSGNSIATPWFSVALTESGQIASEEPGEDAPAGTEYVKTESGDKAVPYIRKGTNGLEYSQDGTTWNETGGAEAGSSGEANVIETVKLNGTALDVTEKAVNIQIEGLTGTASVVDAIADTDSATTSDIATKLNEVIALLQARGIADAAAVG